MNDVTVGNFEFGCDEDRVYVIDTPGGRWIPIEPICELIGINSKRQARKVFNDSMFDCALFDQHGDLYKAGLESALNDPYIWVCVCEDYLARWLFSINHRRISTESSANLAYCERYLLKAVYEFRPKADESLAPKPFELIGATIEFNPHRKVMPWRIKSEIAPCYGATLDEAANKAFAKQQTIRGMLADHLVTQY